MAFEDLIESVLIHIEDNLEESLTLEEVASQFHISKFYFHRIFSAVMGVSFNQYCLSRRMNAAVKHLTESKASLTEIAYLLNFSSQSVFNRTFKQYYGVKPSQVRNTVTKIPLSDIFDNYEIWLPIHRLTDEIG